MGSTFSNLETIKQQTMALERETAAFNNMFSQVLEQYQLRVIINLPDDAARCAFLKSSVISCRQMVEARVTDQPYMFDIKTNLALIEGMSADFCKKRCNHAAE